MARILKGGLRDGKKATIGLYPFDPRAEAEKILSEARHVKAQAQQTQHEKPTGRERGLAAVTELLTAARVQTLRAHKDVEQDLRVLAVRIAGRILGRELTQSPDAIVDIVSEALSQAGAPREVVVRCHPDDLKALERGKPRLIERCSRTQAVRSAATTGGPAHGFNDGVTANLGPRQ